MSGSDDDCAAAFPRQQNCIDRLYSRVLNWASYTSSLALPADKTVAPEKAWIQQRALAERTPVSPDMVARQLGPWFVEDPNIRAKVRQHLNIWNDEATEATLSNDIDVAVPFILPKYAATVVADQEVASWCDRNGYPRPSGLVGVFGNI